jgi:hypothetical protein
MEEFTRRAAKLSTKSPVETGFLANFAVALVGAFADLVDGQGGHRSAWRRYE